MGSATFNNLNNNIYRFIDNILENKKNYQALIGFLNREFPLIDGIKKGDKIIKTIDFNSEIPNVISKLKNSWVYLQGPPGTGKTSMSAVTILELIKKKKKIAITANSHSVIHNLLGRLESLADKKEISFKGIKAGKPDKEDKKHQKKYWEEDQDGSFAQEPSHRKRHHEKNHEDDRPKTS